MAITHDLLNSVVWVSTEKVRITLGWSHEEMAAHLYLTEKEYFQLRTSRKDVPTHSILLLAEELGLDPETLSFGRLDYTALKHHQSGDLSYLPERYSLGALCKRRIGIPILAYSDRFINSSLTDLLLKKLQINRIVFDDPNQTINLRFLTDAFDFFVKMKHSSPVFFQMGTYFSSVNLNNEIGQTLRSLASVRKMYEYFTTHTVENLDQTFSHRLLKLNHTSGTLEIQPTEKAIQTFQSFQVGDKNICTMKSGLMSGIPFFLDLPLASIVETHCIHRDDPSCRFAINFEYAHAVHKKKSKSPDPSLSP